MIIVTKNSLVKLLRFQSILPRIRLGVGPSRQLYAELGTESGELHLLCSRIVGEFWDYLPLICLRQAQIKRYEWRSLLSGRPSLDGTRMERRIKQEVFDFFSENQTRRKVNQSGPPWRRRRPSGLLHFDGTTHRGMSLRQEHTRSKRSQLLGTSFPDRGV